MSGGRAIIVTCDGMEVHNSTIRGVNMVVDVTWNFRGKGNNQKLVMRIVAHASLASSKIKGERQYELFVNGVSYFNFLSVDQLKVNSSSGGGGGVVGNNKRPVQRHSMIEKRGPHYNNIEQHQGSSADSRRHSSGEIGRNHHRPKSLSKSLPQALEQSDRSSSRALSSSSRRKYSQVNNIDESDTSRLSYHSDMSPPLDNDPSLRPGVGGRRMNHNNNSLPTALNGSSRSLRMGKQVQKKLSNGDESDRSARSRDSSLKQQQHTHKTVHSTPASSIDQSDRSQQRRRQVIRSKSAIDRSDRSSSSSSLDRSDLSSRRQKLMKSQSAIDRSDRSSRSDRGNLAQLRSLIMDESDRSARSNPRLQPQQSVKNIYNPVEKPRRETIMSTSSEQTQKVTNSTSSKSKVMQSHSTIPGQVLCEDDEDDNNSVDTMKRALRTSFISVAKSLSPPEGNVTIVYTDVQGSTLLWESCPSAMKKAQDIHDTILRQCYSNHKGYEISTEGDSFNLAFQHPVDALAFALQAQIKLYKADWPQEILNHPDGKEEPYLKFKGLRVRIGINHGPTTNQIHRVTGRMIYAGEGVKIAKAMESLCHGGQILCTIETWKAVGGLAERYLGRPQVIDCGEHLLFDANRTRYSRRIMQIVPNELAFDFFEARGQAEDGTVKDASLVRGRFFPPLPSKKQ